MVRAKNVELAYIKEQSGDIVIGQSADYFGSSTDTKPTDKVVGGSTFIETDTGNFYYFDENSSTWVKKNESGGGSSDFSTAVMTIVLGTAPTYPVGGIFIDEEAQELRDQAVYTQASNEHLIVLYKGSQKLFFDTSITVSGNATIDGEAVIVSGDCTITLNQE